ncbi:MAG: hypothetical protein ACYSUI_08485, partial [Planctomycetota bacterium]
AFAFERGLILHEITFSTAVDKEGQWVVRFETTVCYATDGGTVECPWNLHPLLAFVRPDGSCYLVGDGFWPRGSSECSPDWCVETLDEPTAIDIAETCAITRGRIPSRTVKQAERREDGTWLVSLVPGRYRFRRDSGNLNISDYEKIVVAVARTGECSLIEALRARGSPAAGHGRRPAATR